jgi:hypothetical protein
MKLILLSDDTYEELLSDKQLALMQFSYLDIDVQKDHIKVNKSRFSENGYIS